MDSSWAREAETLTISSEVSVPVSIFSFSNLTVTPSAEVPAGGETVAGVPGKSGDGLDHDLIDLALPAVCHQAVEVLTLIHPGAGQTLVCVDVHQIPAIVGVDRLRIGRIWQRRNGAGPQSRS